MRWNGGQGFPPRFSDFSVKTKTPFVLEEISTKCAHVCQDNKKCQQVFNISSNMSYQSYASCLTYLCFYFIYFSEEVLLKLLLCKYLFMYSHVTVLFEILSKVQLLKSFKHLLFHAFRMYCLVLFNLVKPDIKNCTCLHLHLHMLFYIDYCVLYIQLMAHIVWYELHTPNWEKKQFGAVWCCYLYG